MNTKTFSITGMHCKSCEILIRDAIEEIDGCHVKNISSKTGKLTIECADDIVDATIRDAIHTAGYRLSDEEKITEKAHTSKLSTIAWILFSGILLYLIFQIDLTRLIPSYEKLGFGIAFLVGLVASVSTCLAVTGGIVVGYTESIVDKTDGFKTQLRFHIGRIITFVIGGFLLGLLGTAFTGSLYLNGILNILVGVVLTYIGLQLLGVVSNISRWGFHLPTRFSRNITKLKDPKYSPWVGALTFLLPCGFTQSMMLSALASGSPWQGVVIMGGFVLGTFPVLFTLGLGTEYIKDKLKILNPLIASLLLAFGIFTISNGWKILDAKLAPSTQEEQAVENTKTIDTSEVLMSVLETENIAWGHDGYGFSPRTLSLKAGKNYTVNVTPSANGLGCLFSVILPNGQEQYIKKGEPFEIRVNGSTPKDINLVCASMGMSQGRIVIK